MSETRKATRDRKLCVRSYQRKALSSGLIIGYAVLLCSRFVRIVLTHYFR